VRCRRPARPGAGPRERGAASRRAAGPRPGGSRSPGRPPGAGTGTSSRGRRSAGRSGASAARCRRSQSARSRPPRRRGPSCRISCSTTPSSSTVSLSSPLAQKLPTSRARSRNAFRSAVFPIPGWPSTHTTRGLPPLTSLSAASRTASSPPRPTKGPCIRVIVGRARRPMGGSLRRPEGAHVPGIRPVSFDHALGAS
jgi:hypothetical protein